MTAAVIVTPSPQPDFKPTYRFETAINAPMPAAATNARNGELRHLVAAVDVLHPPGVLLLLGRPSGGCDAVGDAAASAAASSAVSFGNFKFVFRRQGV